MLAYRMIRYRLVLVLICALASLAYLGAWRAADAAPGVRATGEGLAVPLDDVAIYFQYARQALDGEWLRYNPGAELSTGVTSPTYFLLLTACMGLGLSGPLAAWLLGAAALLLGVVAMDRLGRSLFPHLPPWWAPALLLSHGAWIGWSFNGMETGLLLALSLCALLAALEGSRRAFFAALAALAFTRPEGQVLAALLALSRAVDGRRRDAVAGLILAAAPTALLYLLSGGLVPDSLRPKSAALLSGADAWTVMARWSDYSMGLMKGLWLGFWSPQDGVGSAGDGAALNPVSPLYPPLLLLAAFFGFFALSRGERRGYWLAVAAALLGLGGLLAWQLPVGWHVHRYSAAAAPLLWLGGLGALQALRREGGLGRPAAAALFSLWAAFGLASWPWHLQRTHSGAVSYALANRNAALSLDSVPAGPVAVADAGLLAYYSGREIVDLLGITDHGLALAQAEGKGAVLEALLSRQHLPRWAVLHAQRPDMDLDGWRNLGLLRNVDGVEPGKGMLLLQWQWHDAAHQARPYRLPQGWSVDAELNVGRRDHEKAAGYRAQGPRAGRSRALNHRLRDGGPQVPEGGREVLGESFAIPGQGLMVRALFDRPGRLRVLAQDGRTLHVSIVGASPAEAYSELFLPLPESGPQHLSLAFENEKGQPTAWVSCHLWSVSPSAP